MLLLGPLPKTSSVSFLHSVPCERISLKLHRREPWKAGEITRTVFSPRALLSGTTLVFRPQLYNSQSMPDQSDSISRNLELGHRVLASWLAFLELESNTNLK